MIDGAPSLNWAITIKDRGAESDELVGIIELRPQQETGQRGFWIARAFQNKGYMTEAIHATNDYWFNVLGRDVLCVTNAESNHSSSRLKKKTAGRLVAVTEGKFLDPAFTRAEHWETTKEEWAAFKCRQVPP